MEEKRRTRQTLVGNPKIVEWIRTNDQALYENAVPYKDAARRIAAALPHIRPSYQAVALTARRLDGLQWAGRNKRLIYGERSYAPRTWARLHALMDDGRERFSGRTPAAVAQMLLAEGPRFAIPAIAEMMRLLKMNPKGAA